MNSAEIISRLKAMEPALRRSGIGALYLFGSRARGDYRADSDVDLAFEANGNEIDLWTRAEIMALVHEDLGFDVDLADRSAMYAKIRASAEAEMVQVF